MIKERPVTRRPLFDRKKLPAFLSMVVSRCELNGNFRTPGPSKIVKQVWDGIVWRAFAVRKRIVELGWYCAAGVCHPIEKDRIEMVF